MSVLEKIAEALIGGDYESGEKLCQQAIDESIPPRDVLNNGLLKGMDVIGERFKNYEVYIPEVLLSAKVMHTGMGVLRPLLSESEAAPVGTIVLGTVQGDLHDIGKNLVGMMLEGARFKVINIGIDQPPEAFVQAVSEHKPDIVGMSALLTTTMPKIKDTIEALEKAGLRDRVKIMAGGAAVSQDFIEEIGGDAYGSNATVAIEKAREFMNISR